MARSNVRVCQTKSWREGDEVGDVLDMVKEEVEVAEVGAGRVLVRMTARPINPYDLLLIHTGVFLNSSSSRVPGCEGAGIVEKVGPGVTRVRVGQRVAPWLAEGPGSWQQVVEVAEEAVFAVPPSLPDEEAAQMLLNPATLYGLLSHMAVPPDGNHYLLQTRAASVLGRQVIQLAKYKGFKTINLVRRDDVKEELKTLGADEVINTTTEDVVARVREITGGKLAYGSIDAIAGPLTKIVMACTRDNGDVLIYGGFDGQESEAVVGLKDLLRKVRVRWFNVCDFIKLSEEKSQADMEEIIELQAKGVMKPLVGETYPLSEYKKAIQESERPKRGGKVLLIG